VTPFLFHLSEDPQREPTKNLNLANGMLDYCKFYL